MDEIKIDMYKVLSIGKRAYNQNGQMIIIDDDLYEKYCHGYNKEGVVDYYNFHRELMERYGTITPNIWEE